jgi:hypothetical protein
MDLRTRQQRIIWISLRHSTRFRRRASTPFPSTTPPRNQPSQPLDNPFP